MLKPNEPPSVSAILARMPAYGSEFAKTYANHAPMVLTALDRMGATPDRMAISSPTTTRRSSCCRFPTRWRLP